MDGQSEISEVPTPSPVEMKAIVAELARVKSCQDITAALAIYHPEATLLAPPLGSHRKGGRAVLKGLEEWFRFAPDYSVSLEGQAVDGDTLCAWGTIRFTPAFTFRGDKPNGAAVATPVFILFRFADRRVSWESLHFDLADVARQIGVSVDAFARP